MRGKERDALPHVVVYVEYVVYVGHPYVELQLMRFLWHRHSGSSPTGDNWISIARKAKVGA